MVKAGCTALILSLLSSFQAQAGDDSLLKAVKLANESLNTSDISCSRESLERACPPVLQASFKDIYRKGTAGTINAIISDGSLKNPRSVCATSALAVKNVDLGKLSQQLEKHFPDSPQLHDYTSNCSVGTQQLITEEHQKTDGHLSQAYMMYDFNFKSQAIKQALNDLLDSQSQINLILPGAKANCSEFLEASVQEHCRELHMCKNEANPEHFLKVKTEEVGQALRALQTLQVEHDKLTSGMGKLSSENRQRAKLLREDMERIKDFNPLLKGEKFKNLNGKFVPEKVLKDAVKGQLEISRKEIDKKLKAFNGAYKCLVGNRSQCEDFDQVIGQAKYTQSGDSFFKDKDLAYASTFHQCAENIKAARNEADVVLNDVGINLALLVTPYAVVSGVKLSATLARIANVSSKVVRAESATAKVGLAANAGYGGYHTLEEFEQCQREIKAFQNLGARKHKMTCQNVDRILVSNSNNSRCITQALISAALMTPMAAESLRLAKNLPKVSLPQGEIKALTEKIRSGQSLSKSEEALLLSKLQEKNPLDKLLVKGVSSTDKAFATKTLDDLYLQRDVAPEDLLKLSKLIKERNPPLLIITRQDNVDDILNSGKIWGSTEGSVYAAARPAETKLDKIKTGVHGDKEGTFIFTPEAAGLFKAHEVTGLYSGFKRAAGQYKGPFGDIVIESSKKTIIDGRPYIVVTKARRAGSDEALHSGQSSVKAAVRLTGRRAVLDPLATGTGAIVSIQAASAYTGTSVSDILEELLTSPQEEGLSNY